MAWKDSVTSLISHRLAVTGTSEWEQRSQCGCHTHSSLHSPFALPAVSPSPPTASEPHPPAVAIHQANPQLQRAHVNAPGLGWLRGGLASPKALSSSPAGCSLPICHPDWLTALLEARCYLSPPPAARQHHAAAHGDNNTWAPAR